MPATILTTMINHVFFAESTRKIFFSGSLNLQDDVLKRLDIECIELDIRRSLSVSIDTVIKRPLQNISNFHEDK